MVYTKINKFLILFLRHASKQLPCQLIGIIQTAICNGSRTPVLGINKN